MSNISLPETLPGASVILQNNFSDRLSKEVEELSEEAGVKKANSPPLTTFVLGILAGAFIAFGAYFAIIVSAGAADVWYGGVQLLKGIVFSMGLVLVIAGGAELFTGNILIVMACASRKVTLRRMLRNWGLVFAGNFVGAAGTAVLLILTGVYTSADGGLGIAALKIAASKAALAPSEAFFRGIMCNVLVCIAIWVALTARTIGGKIAALTLPIAMFVAAGFEHCVANMFFFPYALLLSWWDPVFVAGVSSHVPHLESLTWGNFLFSNLPFVSLGNIVGGGGFVGMAYWVIYKYLPTLAPAKPEIRCSEELGT
jgi:formate/nitrite transporter